MATDEVMFTALPAGLGGSEGAARVSIFTTLRSAGGADVLRETRFADWAATVNDIRDRLLVEVEGHGEVVATPVPPLADPTVWRLLFPPELPVRPHEQERWTQRPVATYDTALLHDHALATVRTAALASPTTAPGAERLAVALNESLTLLSRLLRVPLSPGRSGRLGLNAGRMASLLSRPLAHHLDDAVATHRRQAYAEASRRLDAETGHLVATPGDYLPAARPGGMTPVQQELERFLVFHHRPEAPPVAMPGPDDLVDCLDLHALQTALGTHHWLLRTVGLVIDLDISLDVLADEGRIRLVRPEADLPDVVTPWTAYRLNGAHGRPLFRAAPRPDPVGERVVDGLIDLRFDERYRLLQLDVESATFKMLTASLAVAPRALAAGEAGPVDADATPALQSTGIALVHGRRPEALHANAAGAHNAALETAGGGEVTFWAEDTTRGYRLDVEEGLDGHWRSLHARVITYRALDGVSGVLDQSVTDEGFTQLALTEDARPPGEPADLTAPVYLHESMARWEGWSLAAPRPGLMLSRDAEPTPLPDDGTALPDGVPVDTTCRVQPGSLPRLRFGGDYRVRARAVDLACNGLELEDADELIGALDGSGDEPLLPVGGDRFPFRRFDPVPAPGLVLRHPVTDGESIDVVVIRSDPDVSCVDFAMATGYRADAQRHVVAAKTSLQHAELAGSLDAFIGSQDVAAVRQTYAVAAQESARLVEVHDQDTVTLPYLPDPWSAGAVLAGVPGLAPGTVVRCEPDGTLSTLRMPDAVSPSGRSSTEDPEPACLVVPWGPADVWWQPTPLRIRLVEGTGEPTWEGPARLLTLHLPKAGWARLALSSLVDPDRVEQHGVWRLLADGGIGADEADGLRRLALLGRLWAVTPPRPLTLVHAVRRPLSTPEILAFQAERNPGGTRALLGGEIRVHGASTERLDLLASWTEWVDRDGSPPTRRQRSDVALTALVRLARDVAPSGTAEATTSARFVEADDLLVLSPSDADGVPVISQHELHDTKHLRITYTPVGSTRFREYFRSDLVDGERPDSTVTRAGEGVAVDVPNASPPPPPELLYAMPLFGWERTHTGRHRTSRRRGGGIRLILRRPWFTSGDGELLGVVLPQPCSPAIDPMPPPLTLVGADPTWPEQPGPGVPVASDFLRAVIVADALPLSDSMRRHKNVTVVGHEVEYDAERDAWVCDIELRTSDVYMPFVRLALARLQPISIDGAHLSQVVTARMIQVAPDRHVSVVSDSDDPRQLSVTVTGVGHEAALGLEGTPVPYGTELDVHVQERVGDVPDPDLGWRIHPDADVVPHRAAHRSTNEFIRWSGRVRLPEAPTSGRFRLVITELERLPGQLFPPEDRPPPMATVARIVFAETVPL